MLRVYFLRQVYTLKGVTIKTTNTIYKILKAGIVAEIGLQKGIKKADTFRYPFLFFKFGRLGLPQIRKKIPSENLMKYL